LTPNARRKLKGKVGGPLAWYGGKCKLVKELIPLMPDHKTYVEVFAGGAALFWAKERSRIEILNDLNSGLVNFYRVLSDKEKFEEFQFRVELMPYSREEYLRCRATWNDAEDDVERAVQWFVVARQCFSGVWGGGWAFERTEGRGGISKSVARYLSAIDRLPEVYKRIRGVQVENKDFRYIIKTYDSPNTFFYLDPPYVTGTRKSKKVYVHEMTDDDHEDMVELLLRMKGKAMLSGYESAIYGPLECQGWKRYDLEAMCTAGIGSVTKNTKDKREVRDTLKRTETVWVRG